MDTKPQNPPYPNNLDPNAGGNFDPPRYSETAPPMMGPPTTSPQMMSPPMTSPQLMPQPVTSQPMMPPPMTSPPVNMMSSPGGIHTNVIVGQPAVTKYSIPAKNFPLPRTWNQNLCGCFNDMEICCLTMFCPFCMACSLASKLGEGCCMLCCTPLPLLSLRVKTRMIYGIQGSVCSDCLAVSFCGACVQCQMHEQLKENVEIHQ